MKIVYAMTMLLINFIKISFVSGLDTIKIIIKGSASNKTDPRDGVATIKYGQLGPETASLLGAMLTLTPGTSLIDVDIENRELVMHLLNLDQYDEIVSIIQRDFCVYLRMIDRGTA